MTTPSDVEKMMDALVARTSDVERRLAAEGQPDAHLLMFSVREVLLDLKRTLTSVAALPDSEDLVASLRELTADFVYGTMPHALSHLREVLELLEEPED